MSVVTIRAPDAAMGWPRLQPLPEKLTSSSSIPYSRHAAIGTEAKASLISQSATSDGFRPARSSTLPITFHAPSPPQPAVACGDTRCAPSLHGGHHGELVGIGVVTLDEGDSRGGVVRAAAVARGDREALDLGGEDLAAGALLR